MIKWIALLIYCLALNAAAAITVQDGDGQIVTLAQPAKRIISLSPAITELIFAAGGGDSLVGVIMFSDFPEQAKRIPVVGDSRELDLERIITLKPDLFVVWRQGISAKQIEQLRKLNVPLFFSDEQKLADISLSIRKLGQLMGTEQQANKAAGEFDHQLAALTKKYADVSPVPLFYQVSGDPLITLNGQQIVSDAIRLCGGVNLFASQTIIAPQVSIEAVLEKNPEAIIGTSDQNSSASSLAMWKKRYPLITAVKQHNLFELNGHLIHRASPRMLAGVADLCGKLDQARKKRR